MTKRDLFVAVPDLDLENTIKTLLCERQEALGIRLTFDPGFPGQGDLLRYNRRDSGCYRNAPEVLRGARTTHNRVLLLFDRHGSGAEAAKGRAEIEGEVERRLYESGWAPDCACVVVLEPELEAWVWAKSSHVAEALGWGSGYEQLRSYLESEELWRQGEDKPHDPKGAMEAARRKKRSGGGSATVFAGLARRVSMARCADPAFKKLRSTLQRWFPARGGRDERDRSA